MFASVMYTSVTCKRVILLCLLFLSLHVNAQEKLDFNVVSFREDPLSTTAKEKIFEKIDGDGNKYAIIKVKSDDGDDDLDAFTFNFGALNSLSIRHDDELWVYVQRNAKTVTIKRPGYKTIEKFDLNTTIRSGVTYEMRITMSRVHKFVEHDITKQILQFVITPSKENAIVKVKRADTTEDYELWGEVDETGSIDKIMDFGAYDYVVTAKDYEASSGRVVLSDSKKTFVENVTLKPDFGYLLVEDVDGSTTGSQFFIDDEKVGVIPYRDTTKRWSSGEHRITVTKGELYKTYNATFEIRKGDTTILKPVLESDFALTTIRVDAEAEIFVDGKSKGQRIWKGPLKTGQYVVECRQKGYRPSSSVINIRADEAEVFDMPAPVAITGSLYVSSTPAGASINIDEKYHGATPKLIHDVLIGDHHITLSLKNHKTEQCNVTVKENETENINVKLSDIANMTIESRPANAELYINGFKVGSTPFTSEMSSGDYDIELRHKKYSIYKKRIHLDSSVPSVMIDLKRQYQRPYSFYVQPFVQLGGNMSVGANMGGYIANVNIEAHYALSTKESEMIYWNTKSADERTCGYTYKASSIGGKLGYGFVLNRIMRITPQVGVEVVNLKSSKEYNVSVDFDASKANVVNASLGVKYEYAFANGIGVFISPACSFAVKKSAYFSEMEQISSIIKAYASAFSLRTGVTIFF